VQVFQDRITRAEEAIARGDHKHGGQELYDAIMAAHDIDELRAVQPVVERELERAGWRHRGRYKELRRVLDKHLDRFEATVPA
jgi:hypothetical protein